MGERFLPKGCPDRRPFRPVEARALLREGGPRPHRWPPIVEEGCCRVGPEVDSRAGTERTGQCRHAARIEPRSGHLEIGVTGEATPHGRADLIRDNGQPACCL